jgi:hypothetical protein
LEYQTLRLLGCELKHEIRWKSIPITIDSLVQIPGTNAVELRQIEIEEHFLAAQMADSLRDPLDGNHFLAHSSEAQANSRAI